MTEEDEAEERLEGEARPCGAREVRPDLKESGAAPV